MRRNTKTMYEWRKAYRDKEELMLERGFPEVSPHEFYRDLFPEGSLQSAEHDGKGNLIATQIRPSGKGRTKQWVVDDSLNMLDKVIGDEFGLIPPITFYGKTLEKLVDHVSTKLQNTPRNASKANLYLGICLLIFFYSV